MMSKGGYTLLGLFLLILGILTTTINSWNAKYFGLQNATVAGLVQNHTFALVDQVIPGFNLVEGTETFRFGQAVYPMKQPGPTILGAMIYYPLYQLNLTYDNHFDYVSHLVTFGTSSIMIALSAVMIYFLSFQITKKQTVAISASLIYPLATIIWPYAGVSHHDIYGSFFSLAAILAFYQAHTKNNNYYLVVAGILSTLTLFFTMLPLTLPIALWTLIVMSKNIQKIITITTGMVIGFLPNAVFNWLVFQNPLTPPNLAGSVSDTMPLLSLPNFLSKLWFYLLSPSSSIFLFSPVILYGIGGIYMIRKTNPWLMRLLCTVPLLQLVHVSSIETIGGFQYGPRYLLPTLSCLTLGVAIWMAQKHSKWGWRLFRVVLTVSVLVSLIGAVSTVMYPMPGPYAPIVLAQSLMKMERPEFRMLLPGLLIIWLSGVSFWIASKRRSS